MAVKDMKTLSFSGGTDTYKVVDGEAVHFTEQTLTAEQKAQVLSNLGINLEQEDKEIQFITSGDLNDYKTPDTYYFVPSTYSANVSNIYWTSEVNLFIAVKAAAPSNQLILQIGYMFENRRIMTRYYNANEGTWSNWTWFHNSAYVIGLGYGGTGATSAAGAREKLEITPANIGAAAASHTHSNYASSNHTHSNYLQTSKIVYSSSQPSGSSGMIWLKPK